MDKGRRKSRLTESVRRAVAEFWATRSDQSDRQGRARGARDAGNRTVVTGGAQMGGFVRIVCDEIARIGLPESSIFTNRRLEMPGWFRAEKKWDLVVVHKGELLALVEFKSQVGPSFGNNFNNRTEEALGSATDLWAAYREGAMRPSARPWLGYLMLFEKHQNSTSAVRVVEPHFPVFPEFRGTSYAQRYQVLLQKLQRERLYDATCLLLTDGETGPAGDFDQPEAELGLNRFFESLMGRVMAAMQRSS